MLFHPLAAIFEQLEQTSSGNKMREILSAFLKEVPPDDIDKVCYLTLGSIASSYEDINLGMADQMIIRSIANAAQKEERKIAEESKKLGDLGLVAEKEATEKSPTITISDIFKTFNNIAEAQAHERAPVAVLRRGQNTLSQ
jgi:DNA ligase-1